MLQCYIHNCCIVFLNLIWHKKGDMYYYLHLLLKQFNFRTNFPKSKLVKSYTNHNQLDFRHVKQFLDMGIFLSFKAHAKQGWSKFNILLFQNYTNIFFLNHKLLVPFDKNVLLSFSGILELQSLMEVWALFWHLFCWHLVIPTSLLHSLR